MKKLLLLMILGCSSIHPSYGQECPAVTTLNQNFSSFTNGALPQNCWTGSHASPSLTASVTGGEGFISFYTFMNPAAVIYAVSPELSTIDGQHALSFDAYRQTGSTPGNITVQAGTLSIANDFSTFVAINEPTLLTNAVTHFENIVVPASTTQKYIAFKVSGSGIHQAVAVDNVVWDTSLNTIETPKNNASFTVYPNPTMNKAVTLSYNSNNAQTIDNSVSIYSITGSKVFETKIENNGGLQQQEVNLSNLSSGMYILTLTSGNHTESKKLVIK